VVTKPYAGEDGKSGQALLRLVDRFGRGGWSFIQQRAGYLLSTTGSSPAMKSRVNTFPITECRRVCIGGSLKIIHFERN
jgi:hypothetical protein